MYQNDQGEVCRMKKDGRMRIFLLRKRYLLLGLALLLAAVMVLAACLGW